MKCDNCKNQKYERATEDCPGSDVRCSKTHWFGLGNDDDLKDETMWDDCPDFVAL